MDGRDIDRTLLLHSKECFATQVPICYCAHRQNHFLFLATTETFVTYERGSGTTDECMYVNEVEEVPFFLQIYRLHWTSDCRGQAVGCTESHRDNFSLSSSISCVKNEIVLGSLQYLQALSSRVCKDRRTVEYAAHGERTPYSLNLSKPVERPSMG